MDVAVTLTEAGDFKTLMPDDGMSMLSVDRRYEEMSRSTKDARAREYLGRKIKKARQFMESIQQRREILQRIAKVLFRHQRTFLERGPDYIRPVYLQELANETGLSTIKISCALQSKRAQTPHGVFALEDFVIGLPGPSEN
jgi:RNA polymerase sigma-54 factor